MSTKHQRQQARLFFSRLRPTLLPFNNVYRADLRPSRAAVLALAAEYDLSSALERFISLGVAGHHSNKESIAYKKTDEYATLMVKWLRLFHAERCATCDTRITHTYRGTPLEPLRPSWAKWCSQRCQNGDPEMRKINSDSVSKFFQDPKRKAAWIRKQRTTSMRLHGVPHQNQTKEARARIGLHAKETGYSKFRLKTLEYAGHKWEGLQGYEPRAVKMLVDEFSVKPKDIVCGSAVPAFRYYDKERKKKRVYFPDLLVRGDTFIEVKSEWTLRDKSNVKCKLQAVLDAGFRVGLLVLDSRSEGHLYRKIWSPDSKPRKVTSQTPHVI